MIVYYYIEINRCIRVWVVCDDLEKQQRLYVKRYQTPFFVNNFSHAINIKHLVFVYEKISKIDVNTQENVCIKT